ncbi:MAG: hypothetical protein R2882_05585 [Gemmatimonadales bacterium]
MTSTRWFPAVTPAGTTPTIVAAPEPPGPRRMVPLHHRLGPTPTSMVTWSRPVTP